MPDKVTEKYQIESKIKEIIRISDNCLITFDSTPICEVAKAGQFIMVKSTDEQCDDPLMRRPFSIHRSSQGQLSIAFKIVGRGTKLLSSKKKSEHLNIIGPLGNGFRIATNGKHYLVGGGMGIAPLYFLAETIKKMKPTSEIIALLGARTASELEIFSNFSSLQDLEIKISTDDGSKGHHGLVPELLAQTVKENGVGMVYCCGPWPMMKAVATYCREKQMPCQVSLETTMACGIGACLGCAVSGSNIMGKNYVHVCKDGPVFEANEIW